jgi:hypothetical protein
MQQVAVVGWQLLVVIMVIVSMMGKYDMAE